MYDWFVVRSFDSCGDVRPVSWVFRGRSNVGFLGDFEVLRQRV
jgi:hypothetical protein